MRANDDMAIPERLADVVRRAAAAVPAGSGDLGAIRHRFRVRRRRRVALTAGLAALLVGAAAGTVPVLARAGGDRPGAPIATGPTTPAPATTSAPVPVAQRLLLPMDDGHSPGLRFAHSGLPEVLPDGRLAYHQIPEEAIDRVVALPDGRLVVLDNYDKTPGVIEQPDGPNNPAVGYKLVVFGANGAVTYSRDVYVPGQGVSLLGAAATEAYLLRPAGVVAHAFGSGAERLVLPARAIGPWGAADIVAGRLAAVDTRACVVLVVDLASGRHLADLRPPMLTCGSDAVMCSAGGLRVRSLFCFDVGEARLSPDGSRLAIRHDGRFAGSMQTRLTVLDVSTGAVLLDRLLATYTANGIGVLVPPVQRFPAIAWADARTVRMAVVTVPDFGKDRLVEDVLTVETIRVG